MQPLYDLDVVWSDAITQEETDRCENNSTAAVLYDPLIAQPVGQFNAILTGSTVLQGGLSTATPGVEYLYTTVNGSGTIVLRMSMAYLEPRSRMTLVDLNTFKYEFFVGIVFVTLKISSTEILTTVIQRNLEFTKSDIGVFAVGTEQEKSIIKQVDSFLHQAPRPGDQHMLQYMEVNVDYSTTYVGVKLRKEGLRFAKTPSPPSTGSMSWVYPCASNSSYGFSQADDWTSLFAKQCLPREPVFCSDHIDEGRFWVPFDTSHATKDTSFIKIDDRDRGENLYFSFEVEFTLVGNRVVVETIFGAVALVDFPVMEHCVVSVLDFQSVADTVQVVVKLGLDLQEEPVGPVVAVVETPAAVRRRRLLQAYDLPTNDRLTTSGQNNTVINQLSSKAVSYGDSVIAVVVDGLAFSNSFSVRFQIDNMLIFNFLGADATAYNYVMSQIKRGTGLDISMKNNDTHFTITPAFDTATLPTAMTSCSEMKPTGNHNIRCLWRRAIVAGQVQENAKQSVYFKQTIPSAQADTETETWVKNTFFNYDTNYNNTRKFLKTRCSKAYVPESETGLYAYNTANDGAYGCVFVDPGYRWISKGGNRGMNPLTITDKTVVIGVITLRDIDYSVNVNKRRLLSMNADGTNMQLYPLESDGRDATRLFVRDEDALHDAAASIRSTPPSIKEQAATARAQMRKTLKEHYARRWHRVTGTSVNLLGNKVLGRSLLAVSDPLAEQARIAELMEESASHVFVVANEGVDSSLNIADTLGYTDGEWVSFDATVDKPMTTKMDDFATIVNRYLVAASADMAETVTQGQTTGFTYLPNQAVAVAPSRRLLQVEGYDGYNSRVKLSGIFAMSSRHGTLFTAMFKCILGAAVSAPLNITVEDIAATVTNCTSNTNASYEIQSVLDTVITSCGDKTTMRSLEDCKILYEVLLMAVPGIAFDWNNVDSGTGPTLFFTMRTPDVISLEMQPAAIYNVRNAIALSMSAPMSKVLVEIREAEVVGLSLATSRRLLASPKTVIYVWVYPSTEPVWPLTTTALSAQFGTWRTNMVTRMVPAAFTALEIDGLAQTANMIKPIRPALQQYTLLVPIDTGIDYSKFRSYPTWIDHLALEMKKVLSTMKNTVLQSDIRHVQTTDVTGKNTTRFTLEMSMATLAKERLVSDEIIANADTLEKSMKLAINTMHANLTEWVKIRTDLMHKLTNGISTGKVVVKDEGLGVLMILGIVAAGVVVVAAVGGAMWYRAKMVNKVPPQATVVTNGDAGLLSRVSMPLMDLGTAQMFPTSHSYVPMYPHGHRVYA